MNRFVLWSRDRTKRLELTEIEADAGVGGKAGEAREAGEVGTAGEAGKAQEAREAREAREAEETGTAGEAGAVREVGTAGEARTVGITGTAGTSGEARTAETAGRAGKAGTSLRLCLAGALDTPVFEGRLDKMLVLSSGRPWRFDNPRLNDIRLTAEPDKIRMTCRLGGLDLSLVFAFDRHHCLRINATWHNRTGTRLTDISAGIVFELPRHQKEMVTIPHMIYNNNPSADPDRVVPKLGAGPGRGFICEEHRLPIPCVNVEWTDSFGAGYFSLFSVPAYVETADGKVQYGSLGALQNEGRTTAAALSGTLMFNGEKDVVYTGKSKTAPYSEGYLDFPTGFSLAKEYVLDWGTLPQSGWGFRETVRQGLQLFEPVGTRPLSLQEMIRLKTNAMDDRWRSDGEEGSAGYVKFGDSNEFGNVSGRPLHYMYGWTGQCLKLAWCDATIGFAEGEEERIARCEQAVDFYLRGSRTGIPGLRHGSYRLADDQWDSFHWNKRSVASSRAYGESMADLAEIILLFREEGRQIPAEWIESLREAVGFFQRGVLPSQIYPAAWTMEDGQPADGMITAAGIPCLIAAAKAYRVTGEQIYLDHAAAVMERYYELHAQTFERPFSRSTLDARCEDKEAGMYFFLAAYELYVLTKEERYRSWAEAAADWLLTFVFVWDPAFDRGTGFRSSGFKATGWPGVSVQNHHLDVFFPTFEFWHFGRMTGSPVYERMGRLIFESMGQGICTRPGEWGFTVAGEQAEGFYQTNYHNRGHNNTWNPSWVIALVLANALRFKDAWN